jgi:hypothetical protein
MFAAIRKRGEKEERNRICKCFGNEPEIEILPKRKKL